MSQDVKEAIDNAYNQITEEKRAILHFVHLRRAGLPYDYWSATGDFSLSRIKELMAQGERETRQQLEDHDAFKQEYDALKKERDALKHELLALRQVR
jgi:hypothetical protein